MMNCNCTNGCHQCGGGVIRQEFTCPGTQRVIRHEHIVRHNHDTINEYDIIHCHEHTTRDVVREREEVTHSNLSSHVPNYCGGNDCGDGGMNPMPNQQRTPFWGGRRW